MTHRISRLCLALTCAAALPLAAQNPIIPTAFTPDPAPYVHGDTLYLFTDHDEDDAQYFKMKDWTLYSTTDGVNWTYRGTPISTATFAWAKQGDNAWASQAIEHGGKWYWYVAAEDTTKGLHGIGVAVADAPDGPYHDALGRPLVPGGWGYIDPSVFIDTDGSAWLFWGNNGCWYAELADDMVSFKSEIRAVPGLDDPKAFGPLRLKRDYALNKKVEKTNYEEGPWVYRVGDTYYMEYAAGGVPEHMAYSTAPTIHGPWTYQGRVMDEADNSFTIHGGSVEWRGRRLMFYHNGLQPNGGGFRRSTAVEEFQLDADGKIPHIPFTRTGIRTPFASLNPYARVEAETMATAYGVKTDRLAGRHHYLRHIDNGDWTSLRSVDFGADGPKRVRVCAAAVNAGGTIEFLAADKVVAVVEVKPTGSLDVWQTFDAEVRNAVSGTHDLRLLFRGGDDELFRLDWWQFE